MPDITDTDDGRNKKSWSAKKCVETTVEKEWSQQGWVTWSNARHIAIDKAREPQWRKNGDNRAG